MVNNISISPDVKELVSLEKSFGSLLVNEMRSIERTLELVFGRTSSGMALNLLSSIKPARNSFVLATPSPDGIDCISCKTRTIWDHESNRGGFHKPLCHIPRPNTTHI
jgi:hypothetical protein